MKKLLIAGVGSLLVMGGVAIAQVPPPPPGGPAAEPGPRGPEMGGWFHRGHHGPHGGPMRPPSKAAHFRFQKGDARVDIKCADDEPMKACVDAASALLDKLPK